MERTIMKISKRLVNLVRKFALGMHARGPGPGATWGQTQLPCSYMAFNYKRTLNKEFYPRNIYPFQKPPDDMTMECSLNGKYDVIVTHLPSQRHPSNHWCQTMSINTNGCFIYVSVLTTAKCSLMFVLCPSRLPGIRLHNRGLTEAQHRNWHTRESNLIKIH